MHSWKQSPGSLRNPAQPYATLRKPKRPIPSSNHLSIHSSTRRCDCGAFWKDLTGRLTDSDAFLTGRTLTRAASTLSPDGLTARTPQGSPPPDRAPALALD